MWAGGASDKSKYLPYLEAANTISLIVKREKIQKKENIHVLLFLFNINFLYEMKKPDILSGFFVFGSRYNVLLYLTILALEHKHPFYVPELPVPAWLHHKKNPHTDIDANGP